MQRRMVVSYQCLRTTYWTHLLKASPLKTGLIGCLETKATKYKCTLHNIAAGQISHLHHSGSLQSYTEVTLSWIFKYPNASQGFWSSEMCCCSARLSGSWHFKECVTFTLKGTGAMKKWHSGLSSGDIRYGVACSGWMETWWANKVMWGGGGAECTDRHGPTNGVYISLPLNPF